MISFRITEKPEALNRIDTKKLIKDFESFLIKAKNEGAQDIISIVQLNHYEALSRLLFNKIDCEEITAANDDELKSLLVHYGFFFREIKTRTEELLVTREYPTNISFHTIGKHEVLNKLSNIISNTKQGFDKKVAEEIRKKVFCSFIQAPEPKEVKCLFVLIGDATKDEREKAEKKEGKLANDLQRLFPYYINDLSQESDKRIETLLTLFLLFFVYYLSALEKEEKEALKEKVTKLERVQEGKVKVSSHYLNAFFTTDETLKNYKGQLDLFNISGDIEKTKKSLNAIITSGFKGIDLTLPQSQVMKGIFSLIDKQGANEERPHIVIENIRQLYEEILEKKVKKQGKYADFSGQEVKRVETALEELATQKHQVVIKFQDGVKKGKPLYGFYMKEDPLIKIEYIKREIPEEDIDGITVGTLKKTGQVRITIMPVLIKDYNRYFKILPKDISKQIRETCPEIKRVSAPMIKFIDWLHRQEKQEVRIKKPTLVKMLKLEVPYKSKKSRTTNEIHKYYDVAKRLGYLSNYKIDEKGKDGYKVDVFTLNIERFTLPKSVKKQIKENNVL